MPNEQLILTVDETARFLKISRGSAYEAVRQGVIPAIRIGRRLVIFRPALERLFDGDDQGDSA